MENNNKIIGKQTQAVESVKVFHVFWKCFKILGILHNGNKYLYGFYDLLLSITITLFYPLHLTIGLFMDTNQADIFKNLSINITCIAASFKHLFIRYKLRKILHIEQIFAELDNHILNADEREYFNKSFIIMAERINKLYLIACILANTSAILTVVFSGERRLMYPAWFPFDWKNNTWLYMAALSYQFIGVTLQIVQNVACAIYPSIGLCIFAGHVRLVSMRVEKIGHEPKKSRKQNEKELIECIEAHKRLIEIFYTIEDAISLTQLTQFLATGLILGVVLIYLLYYVDSLFAYIYYSVYFVTMCIQIFPSCYYGTVLEMEFEKLPNAIFNSNWPDQRREFRQNLIIFKQLTLKKRTPIAGGIISVSLIAFLATVKMAYSLFAFVMQFK